ncbi:histidine triad nucleotide-binding protein [Leptospira sp. GIMC2001]|uniref:histidine triad nucleotide-binding protein n=1 Tax=Leptospira sp. GIMC2001 TaxID=1513297 RepID=UPI00234A0154|nr:histidine triad nucleotide-binding protein [Leptospira sp. GIMC2001]WCL48117.1 histidine triad nucleotide-binding protein [Leptospira sp. GIMC2001]
MDNCIFCKIINKEIPAKIEYEDDEILGFYDISPQAPVHLVFIPKKHIESIATATEEDFQIIGRLLFQIANTAKKLGLDQSGYRIVNNMGKDGGQTVFHLHFHLLGKRSLLWPPG